MADIDFRLANGEVFILGSKKKYIFYFNYDMEEKDLRRLRDELRNIGINNVVTLCGPEGSKMNIVESE